jgi:hypothetical protein
MSDAERPDIRPTRWRAVIVAEFTTHDYPASEGNTAARQASLVRDAAIRGERDINSSRPVVLLQNLERVDA